MSYREEHEKYVLTQQWNKIRLQALKRANYRCECCNKKDRLNVHHRSYENYKNEKLEDVICLCNECHWRIHEKYKNIHLQAIINNEKKLQSSLSRIGQEALENCNFDIYNIAQSDYSKINFVNGSSWGSTWGYTWEDISYKKPFEE